MNKHKLKLLITRPEKSGRELQHFLQKQGYPSYCLPCFDYQTGASIEQLHTIQARLTRPIVIFISVAAVEFAHQLRPIPLWSAQEMIAVGSATAQALNALGIKALVPKKHDSEGLLALAPLQKVVDKTVLIVRGDGGRELIADALRNRGASVHYFESYRRVWRDYSLDVIKTWRQQQINCILITSNALLEFVVNLINDSGSDWHQQCLWVVASERIAKKAEKMGIKRIINANGASTTAIMTALALEQRLSDISNI